MVTRRKLLEVYGGMLAACPLAASQEDGDSSAHRSSAATSAGHSGGLGCVPPARAALKRLLGAWSDDFRLDWILSENGSEVYEVSASGGQVSVKGSSGVALLRGAYVYLRDSGQAMITWSGWRLDLAARLPDMAHRRAACPYRFVQYFNPCTFGYSTAFWSWERWERELDWMALHGINMPLALDGQEAIWQSIWSSFGVSSAEWNRFTTGPAQLPWHRMGNINNFGGPLPQGWIDQKKELQKKILARIRAFGMTPIVPAFAGHVPEAFLRIYPEAKKFTLLWGGDAVSGLPRESRTFLLHPSETDLFKEVGRRFITEYKREFQTGEYYLADSFNELIIPTAREARYEDLKAFSRNVYESIRAGDPNGKWVMQGWLFANDPTSWDRKSTAAFLSAVPDDRMLIIDYASDMDSVHEIDYHDAPDAWKRLDSFYGKSWIDGMAHTFGGNNNVKGNLPLIASKPFEVMKSPRRGRLAGWGLDMEGIESNEVVYELMTDVGWLAEKVDLSSWIPAYCRSRYGAYPAAMAEAWALLIQSAYGSGVWKTKHAFQSRPSLEPEPQFVETGPVFQKAVELFLSCAAQLRSSRLYCNDLIEFVAQAAGGSIDRGLQAACRAHREGRPEARDANAHHAMKMLIRVDGLLNLRPDRRLETWVRDARSWAASVDEAAYYDSNARLLITFWGWRELEDYASRLYSGLIRDYYLERWKTFFASLAAGRPPALDEWELGWLSAPYAPSAPWPVTDLTAEAHDILDTCRSWRG
jgi:alpha-N-acetylglucosaminidase